jgi:hypothetical protein
MKRRCESVLEVVRGGVADVPESRGVALFIREWRGAARGNMGAAVAASVAAARGGYPGCGGARFWCMAHGVGRRIGDGSLNSFGRDM